MMASKCTSLRVPAPVLSSQPQRSRCIHARAYGDESQYFDLKDLENTVGAWDMYGQEETKRYPSMQADFFQRAASGLTSRGAQLRFITVGFAVSVLVWGGLGAAQAGLPITKGPQTQGENGKGGKKGRL